MGATRSIIIPAFNEAGRLGATLEKTTSYLARESGADSASEVIVVCDGCDDNTEAIARSFEGRLPILVISYARNRGKGYAVRKGIGASTGRVVAFMDADGATPVDELGRLAAPVLGGEAEVVVGSRRAAGAAVEVRQSRLRQALGRLFSWVTQAVLGLRIKDTQCGFKVFDGDLARDLFRRMACDGFAFDLEILAEARERGLRVVERGVEWHEVPGSKVRPLRDGLRMLRALWRIHAALAARRQKRDAAPAYAEAAVVPLCSRRAP